MKTIAIIQARLGSTRLPGKVLLDIAGHTMLWHVVNRVRRAKEINEVVVATSALAQDDAIETFCRQEGIAVYRGSEGDVLDRFYRAALAFHADRVVRITADCPLIDPSVIDDVVVFFRESGADYVSNAIRPTYPDGLDAEVFTFAALETAWREAKKDSEREHVTPYVRLSGKFRVLNYENPKDLSEKKYRWTVDEPRDLEFIRLVYQKLSNQSTFLLDDVLTLLEVDPTMAKLNANTIANEGYYSSLYRQAPAGAAPKLKHTESHNWLQRSLKVIPGGAQTFSKAYYQYVQEVSPAFLRRGKGCRVWDVDGNEYIDYVQGLLPNILGYAHNEVNAAVSAQIAEGHSFSLAHPLEVQLAERLCKIIPCAEKVRFGKNGSDATAGAVRAARAFTGRERLVACGYHGWQDWYVGTTPRNGGVPQAVKDLIDTFPYNDLAALEKLFATHPGKIAAVIMEPTNFVEPAPGFLAGVRKLTEKHGALLIFDEICTGFHFGLGGAQKLYGVTPDLACFGKAMGNGFPISCIVGRADIMKVFEDIFFSFTFAGEVSAMAASLKVLDVLEKTDALQRIEDNGSILKDGFNALAKCAGLFPRFECVGHPRWSLIKFRDAKGADSFFERSLFQQEATKRGVLHLVTHNLSLAHDRVAVEETLEVYASVFKTLAKWLSDPDPSVHLEGKAIQPLFKVR